MPTPIVILGCGYTGGRVAALVLKAGYTPLCTTRESSNLASLAAAGASIVPLRLEDPLSVRHLADVLPDDVTILISVPPTESQPPHAEPLHRLLDAISGKVERVVYLSSTGVYGHTPLVDAATPAAPATARQQARHLTEKYILSGPWSALVLRSAAIYGPFRGVHDAIRRGRYRLAGAGGNYISRIHVDDLARLALAALSSPLTGAFPVADAHPARACDVARFCAELLGVPMPPAAEPAQLSETLRFTRHVDGSEIGRRLNVSLLFPSYREGIPAALAAEAAPSR